MDTEMSGCSGKLGEVEIIATPDPRTPEVKAAPMFRRLWLPSSRNAAQIAIGWQLPCGHPLARWTDAETHGTASNGLPLFSPNALTPSFSPMPVSNLYSPAAGTYDFNRVRDPCVIRANCLGNSLAREVVRDYIKQVTEDCGID